MTTIPTALLIIAGLLVILLIVRASRAPTDETLSAKIKALEAERQNHIDMLRELEEHLHLFGNPAVAARVSEVLNRPTQPTGRKD